VGACCIDRVWLIQFRRVRWPAQLGDVVVTAKAGAVAAQPGPVPARARGGVAATAGGPADAHAPTDEPVTLGGRAARRRGLGEVVQDALTVVHDSDGLAAVRADRDADLGGVGVDQTVHEAHRSPSRSRGVSEPQPTSVDGQLDMPATVRLIAEMHRSDDSEPVCDGDSHLQPGGAAGGGERVEGDRAAGDQGRIAYGDRAGLGVGGPPSRPQASSRSPATTGPGRAQARTPHHIRAPAAAGPAAARRRTRPAVPIITTTGLPIALLTHTSSSSALLRKIVVTAAPRFAPHADWLPAALEGPKPAQLPYRPGADRRPARPAAGR
jgi:hypothetical protein